METMFEILSIYLVCLCTFYIIYSLFKDKLTILSKSLPIKKIELNTKIQNEEFLIIRFDENNNILITNNCNLIKDDIINIIKEVSKLKTID